MLSYVYDGSYEGLLCAIRRALTTKEEPEEFLCQEPLNQALFQQIIVIPTVTQTAQQLAAQIKTTMGQEAAAHCYYVSLADTADAPLLLYQYIQHGVVLGKNLDRDLTDDRVRRVHQLSRQVTGERHRLLGLARFNKLPSGVFYSKISPDHRVLVLMASHFAARLAQDRWILHDIKREWAIFGDHGHYQLAPLPQAAVQAEEEDTAKLWQQYFAHIAIANRRNPRCQANCMPRRYWDHLTEKPGQAAAMQEDKKRER